MNYPEEEIIEFIIDELHEVLRCCQMEDSIKEVIELDQENQTITIKFKYNSIPEDNYIGLGSY